MNYEDENLRKKILREMFHMKYHRENGTECAVATNYMDRGLIKYYENNPYKLGREVWVTLNNYNIFDCNNYDGKGIYEGIINMYNGKNLAAVLAIISMRYAYSLDGDHLKLAEDGFHFAYKDYPSDEKLLGTLMPQNGIASVMFDRLASSIEYSKDPSAERIKYEYGSFFDKLYCEQFKKDFDFENGTFNGIKLFNR